MPELWENIGERFVPKLFAQFHAHGFRRFFQADNYDYSHRTEIEQRVQQDLSQYFKDKGINCEGFLLSEVRAVDSQGKDKVLVKEETTIQSSPYSGLAENNGEHRQSIYPPQSE